MPLAFREWRSCVVVLVTHPPRPGTARPLLCAWRLRARALLDRLSSQIQPPALAPMPTLGPTAASTAEADRAALHTTASGVPNEHVSRLRQ